MRPAPAAALLLVAAVAVPSVVAAQAADELRGRVVLGPDTSAVAGQTVVLHRVTADTGMAVDSAATGADGGFSFSLRGDSADVFVVSARHTGVLYFGPVVHASSPPDPYRVTVYDVRTVAPSDTLRFTSRALVLTPDSADVGVTDVVQIAGAADRTLVGDTAAARGRREPWWSVRLPEGARDVRVLPGGVGARQVELTGGQARLSAPVPPSGARVVLGYTVPRGEELRLRPLHPVDHLEVVVRQDVRGVTVDGLPAADDVISGGRSYRRYADRGVVPGRTVRVALAGGAAVPRGTWIAAGIGLLLAAGAAVAWRRSRPPREA